MKTYTTDEVIALFNQYQNECGCEEYEGWSYNKSFAQWLKDKEQSKLPVKGQMIWVRDKLSDGDRFSDETYSTWQKREFSHFNGDYPSCFSEDKWIDDKTTINWDEYSLTDPNQ